MKKKRAEIAYNTTRQVIKDYPILEKYLIFLDRNIFDVKISDEYAFYLNN